MNQLTRNVISGGLLAFASAAALAAGAGQPPSDSGKAERSDMQSGTSAGVREAGSSGASGSNPSQAEEPTGAPGTTGRSGATTTRGPNDVVDKPKGMDQPAGSVPPDRNTTTR